MKPKTQVANYLEKTGLPPYKLAILAGIPNGTFYNWLRGKGDLKLSQWIALEKLINKAA